MMCRECGAPIPAPPGLSVCWCQECGSMQRTEPFTVAGSFICSCGEPKRPESRFCPRCGEPIAPPQCGKPPDEPERATRESLADGCPEWAVRCCSEVSEDTIDPLLEQLNQLTWGVSLAEQIAKDLRRSDYRWVRLTAVHTLSKRCHPVGNSDNMMIMELVARKVSKCLFGFVVEKKLVPDDHRGGPVESIECEVSENVPAATPATRGISVAAGILCVIVMFTIFFISPILFIIIGIIIALIDLSCRAQEHGPCEHRNHDRN